MSDDGTRWCGSEDENAALYTFLPINHKHAASICDGSVNFMQNTRNRNRIIRNRDIRCVRRKCSNDAKRNNIHHHQHSSTIKSSRSYRLINCFLVIALLHMISNKFVTSVNCDELLDSVAARGHFTQFWAVQIPGGDEVAQQVAQHHGMELKGKVS